MVRNIPTEGIYTITVTNEYTGQFTVKKIYVGTNNVLSAHMITGLSIPEINNLVEQGATIADDGTIQLATIVQTTPELDESEEQIEPSTIPTNPSEDVNIPAEDENQSGRFLIPVFAAIGACILCAVSLTALKKRRGSVAAENKEKAEGGTEE